MFPDVVVVVGIAQGLVQQVLLTVDVHGSGDVELVVIGAMRAFDMGILLTVPLVVLDQLAAEASDQLAQLGDLQPGLPAELLAVIDGEDDFSAHTMGAKPGDDPQVPTEAVGPRLLSGVSDEFEA